jgi:hypothetical protein
MCLSFQSVRVQSQGEIFEKRRLLMEMKKALRGGGALIVFLLKRFRY